MLIRFMIDLAIPEKVFKAIPADTKAGVRDAIRYMKSKAVKINEGKMNEEDTTRAIWHKCYHDEGKACAPEEDI